MLGEYKRHWMGTGGVTETTVGSSEWVSRIWHDQEGKGPLGQFLADTGNLGIMGKKWGYWWT